MEKKYFILESSLQQIADSIREKNNSEESLKFPDGFVNRIKTPSNNEKGIISGTISGDYANDQVKKIKNYIFQDDTDLTGVFFSEATGTVGTCAFKGCTKLKRAGLPKVTSIGSEAFTNCTRLASIALPRVTSIGKKAFKGCTMLIDVTAQKGQIEAYAFDGCSSLISFNLNTITDNEIPNYAFRDCSSLPQISIPYATHIGTYAFYNCKALTNVRAPEVTSLDTCAFHGCKALTSVDFPKLETIGGYSFYLCNKLNTIILRNTSQICSLKSMNVFYNTPIRSGAGYIYVPDELVAGYKSATNWSTYASKIKPLSELPEEEEDSND